LVTDVDISDHALESGARNFRLNQDRPEVRRCERRAVKADVFNWLASQRDIYDVIVLDPPSLARRETERAGAIESYYRLAALAVPRLAGAGVLVACSCSAHVSTEEFLAAVRRALKRSGKKWTEMEICGHPADHRATFKEAEYLKAIWVRLG
jgi:23S rRNA (cytosine1962-C5)-methyltransferase